MMVSSICSRPYGLCGNMNFWLKVGSLRTLSDSARRKIKKEPRWYSYQLDEHGHLFLDGVKHRNMATCLKDKKFLNFFFRRLRPTQTLNSEERSFLADRGVALERFPYASVCAGEINLLKIAATGFVFNSLEEGTDGKQQLVYGATLKFPFSPNEVYMCEKGRLYHPAPRSAEHIIPMDSTGDDGSNVGSDGGSVGDGGDVLFFHWKDSVYKIHSIDSSTDLPSGFGPL